MKIDMAKLRADAQNLIQMIDTQNDWVGTFGGQSCFHSLLNDIRWNIDGEEKTGAIEMYRKP